MKTLQRVAVNDVACRKCGEELTAKGSGTGLCTKCATAKDEDPEKPHKFENYYAAGACKVCGNGKQHSLHKEAAKDDLMDPRSEQRLNNERIKAGKTGVEAYGVKGFNRTQWRKAFKSVEAMNKWCDENDAEVYGTRSSAEDSLSLDSVCNEPGCAASQLGGGYCSVCDMCDEHCSCDSRAEDAGGRTNLDDPKWVAESLAYWRRAVPGTRPKITQKLIDWNIEQLEKAAARLGQAKDALLPVPVEDGYAESYAAARQRAGQTKPINNPPPPPDVSSELARKSGSDVESTVASSQDLLPVPVDDESGGPKPGDVEVIWTNKDYTTKNRIFRNDPQGAPENAMVKARKFMAELEKNQFVRTLRAKTHDDWQVTEPDGREVVGSARKFAEPMEDADKTQPHPFVWPYKAPICSGDPCTLCGKGPASPIHKPTKWDGQGRPVNDLLPVSVEDDFEDEFKIGDHVIIQSGYGGKGGMAGQDFYRFGKDTPAVVTDVRPGGRVWVRPDESIMGGKYKWEMRSNGLHHA